MNTNFVWIIKQYDHASCGDGFIYACASETDAVKKVQEKMNQISLDYDDANSKELNDAIAQIEHADQYLNHYAEYQNNSFSITALVMDGENALEV